MLLLAYLVSQGTTDPGATLPSWADEILKGGPFAIVVLLLVFDKITTPAERDRLRVENDAYKKDVQELNAKLLQVLPPLAEISTTLKEFNHTADEVQRLAADVKKLVDDMERERDFEARERRRDGR